MTLKAFNLDQDIAENSTNLKTSFEVTSLSAAQNKNIVAFVAEATSTGFLNNAQGNITTTPLSSAFRHISNYYFSSTASNSIPVAHNTNATSSIVRAIQIGRTTYDDKIVTGSVTAVVGFSVVGNNTFVDIAESTISASIGQRGSLVSQSNTSHKVGTVFYDTGTILFHGGTGTTDFLTHASSGFAFGTGVTAGKVAITQLSFKALNILKQTLYFCRAFNKEFNYTNNRTSLSDAVLGTITGSLTSNPTTYITTVGLHNDDGDLVAVAKLSSPIKKTFADEVVVKTTIQY